ncbi:MAG: ABC transporter ATP-binding protein/permease [Candidatus Marinimicrobia bacterium]|nr:ABC transporter ATP-binding protein/permease [Candidatus Neomarinimicrobiota bacterium]
MRKIPLPKLQESRLGQVWFVFFQILKLSWQVSPKLLVLTILTNTIVGLLIYPTLRLEKAFIDGLIQNIGSDFWGTAGKTVIFILFLRFIVAITQDILARAGGFFGNMMSGIFSTYITSLVAKKHIELDLKMIDNPEFQDKFSRIRRESGKRAWGMIWPLANTPMVLAGLASTIVIIFSFNPLVTLVILFLSIPVFWIDAKFIKEEYLYHTQTSPLHRIVGWLEHYLLTPRNILEVKLQRLGPPFSKRMMETYNKIFSGRLDLEKRKTVWGIVGLVPQNIFLLAVGVYLAFYVFASKLTVGSAEMILRAIGSFRGNLTGLVRNFFELYENYLYVNDLVWLLSLKTELVVDKKGRKLAKKLRQGIEFKNVWFRYTDKSPWILKGINLNINPQENIAIVGENGAGKTTLVKLLCRFYDPQKGEILLNGINLKKYSIEDFWQNLSVLFQDFEVYPFTAKESIAYGDMSKINRKDLIKKAAQKAKIDDFIESLKLKYQNPLDPQFEKGVRPSMGQWQRIGLARIFLKDSQIIILDEPTSHVDPKAEEEIFEEIITYAEKKILFLISHRFSTVRRADKIYVVDKGEVIEEGSHEKLMKLKGRYTQLFELQAKGYR